MAQQTLLGGDGVTGETGATHNTKANSNFTELYGAVAAAQADADDAQSDISSHVSANPAHSAANISSAAFGSIGATNVQAALEEIAAEAGAVTIPDATETVEGVAELATQAETNTGTDDVRIVTPLKLKNRDGAVATLSDSSTTDITSDKWTWATAATTRTVTFSFAGDLSEGIITLTGVTLTLTFPSGSLCVAEGVTSSDNTAVITGVSGDKHYVRIRKFASAYYITLKNFSQ